MLNKIIKWIPFFLLYVPFKLFSVLINTKKKVLLFGTGTNLYHDNSKYLFEYILKNTEKYPNFEIYWVTKNKKLFKALKESNIPVLHLNSLICAKYASVANAYFVTSGLLDVFWFINKKTKLVQLWHGTPIKRIGYDTKVGQSKLKRRKILFSRNYQFDRYDYLIIEDEKYLDIFQSSFQIDKKKILPLGQPRNTIFNTNKENNLLINDIKCKLKILSFKKVILYAPTFRDNINSNIRLIKSIITDENKDYLKSNNYCLLVKLHPFLSNNDEINKFLDNSEKEIINIISLFDIQELLLISDAVVTDISSLALDYLQYSNNLYRFFPDYEEYISIRGIFYDITFNELINNSLNVIKLSDISFRNLEFQNYQKQLTNENILKLIKE